MNIFQALSHISKGFSGLGRFLDGVADSFGGIAGVAVVVMTLIMTYGVVVRYVFNAPVSFIDEVATYLLVIVIFLGAGYALQRGAHVRIDIVVSRLGSRSRLWIRAITWPIGAAYLAFVTYETWRYFFVTVQLGRTALTMMKLPLWIPMLAIPVGFSILLAVGIRLAIRDYHTLFRANGAG